MPKTVTPQGNPPSTAIVTATQNLGDVDMLRLAREIAMDVRPIEQILEIMEISEERFDEIRSIPRFQSYLKAALEDWNSATNTAERVKIKSMAFVEEILPEFYARAHDPRESLLHKVEVLKTVSRFAGLGGPVQTAGSGEKMTVTINLGSGSDSVRIERDITPQIAQDELND